jgi:hypothetical protein
VAPPAAEPAVDFTIFSFIACIRRHRRDTRKSSDASRLVGWPAYPRAFVYQRRRAALI